MRRHWFLVLAILLAVWLADAQLPPSGALPDDIRPLVLAEIVRVEGELVSAPDKAAVTYEMARTWALAKQWPESMQWLQRVAGMKAGFDPSRDSVFAELRGTRDFEEVLTAVRAATPAVSHSTASFKVAEGDLAPESVAYDNQRKNFYFGSVRKGKVLRCTASGECSQFAGGLGVVLGLKVSGNALWLLNNSETESELIHYDLASGQVVRKYTIGGAGHNFNDLTISPAGDIYLTDTPAGAVWHLANANADLDRIPGRFQNANGIALSPDASLLYVSTFPDGITVVDMKTGASNCRSRARRLFVWLRLMACISIVVRSSPSRMDLCRLGLSA